jgi:hypothetical protein
MNISDIKLRRLNISQWLRKNKGGDWKYDGQASWWCDDGIRHVSRVAMDCMDEDSPVGYHLYGGDSPEWIYFHNIGISNSDTTASSAK